MENQTTTINQEYDAKDTVWYGRHKQIEYYDPDTKKYMIFAGKGASRVWRDLDYSDLMDHKLADEGRLMRLIRSVDADNIITIKATPKIKLSGALINAHMMFSYLGLFVYSTTFEPDLFH